MRDVRKCKTADDIKSSSSRKSRQSRDRGSHSPVENKLRDKYSKSRSRARQAADEDDYSDNDGYQGDHQEKILDSYSFLHSKGLSPTKNKEILQQYRKRENQKSGQSSGNDIGLPPLVGGKDRPATKNGPKRSISLASARSMRSLRSQSRSFDASPNHSHLPTSTIQLAKSIQRSLNASSISLRSNSLDRLHDHDFMGSTTSFDVNVELPQSVMTLTNDTGTGTIKRRKQQQQLFESDTEEFCTLPQSEFSLAYTNINDNFHVNCVEDYSAGNTTPGIDSSTTDLCQSKVMLPSSRTSLAAGSYNIREQYNDKKLMKKQKKMRKQDHKQKFEGSLTVVWAIYKF